MSKRITVDVQDGDMQYVERFHDEVEMLYGKWNNI